MYPSLPRDCIENYECAASASMTRRAGRASDPLTIPHAQRLASRAAESRGGRRAATALHCPSASRRPVLLASDLDLTAPRRDSVARASTAASHSRLYTPGTLIHSRRPTPTLHAELDVDSSVRVRVMISIRRSGCISSTCEPMVGTAGAAPAPSLHMLMPHHKPPPPYSAPGVRWGMELRRE
ncbi:hypothetical protein K438DRAFT_2025288 [Mycena galopus ATCC 62051]|nr:hypothetical protein K438DRAFT_2025288 [Mycena galopus ATCC 62051]